MSATSLNLRTAELRLTEALRRVHWAMRSQADTTALCREIDFARRRIGEAQAALATAARRSERKWNEQRKAAAL